jgi:hypothetical protein
MRDWQRNIGIVIGLIAAGAILALTGKSRDQAAPAGPILSECDGRMRELTVHYEPSSREIVSTVYRDFLGGLDPDVTVHVVCPDPSAFEQCTALVGPVQCHLRPVIVNHAITTWSRDRWVALQPDSSQAGITTLLAPRSESASEIWPARAGDERVAHDLAAALPNTVRARRSRLSFDGGDFLADNRSVFVVPRVLDRNIQQTVATRAEFLSVVAGEFKREVILLTESPNHHAAMFMAAAGRNTVLVGDPRLGKQLVPAELNLPGGPDWTPATQHLFDAVADQCAAAGYEVRRVPTVPSTDGRTYLTYVNVLLDESGEGRIAYVPVYDGVEALNAAARAIWEELGYEVRPIDCTATYRHFGCLHCLVNVIKRT